jgi:hypothetical protein
MTSKTGISKASEVTTGLRAEKRQQKGIDRLSTVLSNWGWAFVFNRSVYGGWGLAEGRRQRDAKTGI